MKKLITGIAILLIATAAMAQNYLYIEQQKEINGSFRYYIPNVEINRNKLAGLFFVH